MDLICRNCGTAGQPKIVTKRNLFLEILFGMLYTVWRRAFRYDVCRVCGSREMVPMDSPMGKKLQKDFNEDDS